MDLERIPHVARLERTGEHDFNLALDIDTPEQVDQAVWLMRLSHLLYEMSRRGIGDPVTQAELAEFSVTEKCVRSMVASARRWNLDVEPARG